MFFSDASLIKTTPSYYYLTPLSNPTQLFGTSPLLLTYLALNAMFFKIGVFLVISGSKKKKRNIRFLV